MASEAQRSAVPITFGVELEVLLQTDRFTECTRPAWDWQRSQCAMTSVAQRLAKHSNFPVATECLCDLHNTCESCASVPHRNRYRGSLAVHGNRLRSHQFELHTPDEVQEVSYEYYHVQQEDIPSADPWDGESTVLAQVGCEIATPIFEYTNFSQAMRDIDQVIGIIRGAPQLPMITEECGLHIHVGSPQLTLLASQRLMTLVALVERSVIFHLVMKRRFDSQAWSPITLFGLWKTEEGSITEGLRQNVPAPVYEGVDSQMCQLLRRVWEQSSLDDLSNLTTDPKAQGSTLTSLHLCIRPDPKADPTRTTWEFRYPGMTADMRLIEMWATFATACLAACFTDLPTYRQLLNELVDASKENLAEIRVRRVFKALGMADAAPRGDQLYNLSLGHDTSVDWQGRII